MGKAMAALGILLCFAASCFAGAAPSPGAQREVRDEAANTEETGGQSGQQDKALIVWTGKITSTKRSFNQVVIEDPKTLTQKTFTVKSGVFNMVKLGDMVEVKYKEGSNSIENIKVIKSPANEKIY